MLGSAKPGHHIKYNGPLVNIVKTWENQTFITSGKSVKLLTQAFDLSTSKAGLSIDIYIVVQWQIL